MTNLPPNTEIFYTADGSPTLSFSRADGYKEKMHHAGGAVSESVYIYVDALQCQLRLGRTPHVLAVGLGLGYNELLTLAELLKTGVTDFKIWSFESLVPLRRGFESWALEELDGEYAGVLDQTLKSVCEIMNVPADELKKSLRESLESGKIELRGAFPDEALNIQANVVYYDAYSRKMDESLWAEDTLVNSLSGALVEDCVFASYAANGNLGRALKRLGFRLSMKTGFKGKRESTIAFRGQVG